MVHEVAYSATTKQHRLALGLSRHRTVPDGALIHNAALSRLRDELLKSEPSNLNIEFRNQVKQLSDVPPFLAYKRPPIASEDGSEA